MNKSLIVPLIVLVVLIAVYLIIDSARDVTSQSEPFFEVDTTEVDGFTISNQNGAIELKRSGGTWRIADPIDYPAEGRYVNDLMNKLGSMTIENLVTTDSDKDSTYGLDTAGVEVTVTAGGNEIAQFVVGKTAENYRHTYCRKVGDDRIYRVKGTFTGQLKRKQKDWRDKKILEVDKETISRVDFEYPNESFSMVKVDTSWTLEIKDEVKPVNERFVNQTLSVISRLRTFDFVDGDSARAVDFSLPDLNLTITTEVEDTYKFSLVPQDDEAKRYLMKKDGLDNTLFVISQGTAHSIITHPDDCKPVEKED